MTSKEPTGGKQATGIELTQVMPEKTLEEKIREEEEKLKQLKKKSMDSWADTGEKKSFGLSGMLAFTLPRLWKGGCSQKFIVIFNILIVFHHFGNRCNRIVFPEVNQFNPLSGTAHHPQI